MAMLIVSIRPVLSVSTTTAISTVPTVYRSPSSGWDEFAYYTSSSGKVLGVRNGDNLSYGYNTRVYFLANVTIL